MIEGGSSRDHQKTRAYAYESPDDSEVLINLLVETTARKHSHTEADAGAEVIQIFDSWAGVLPPGQFETWVIKPLQKIVAAVKSVHPDLPMVVSQELVLDMRRLRQKRVLLPFLDPTVPLSWATENTMTLYGYSR